MIAIDLVEFLPGLPLTVEQLQHSDPVHPLLQVGIDARQSDANLPVGRLDGSPEDDGDQKNQREHGCQNQRQGRAQLEHRQQDEQQNQRVAHEGHDP